MNHAFEIAGVGLASQQRALDVIANNIANINTLGFKRSDVRFSELVASIADPSNPSTQLSQVSLAGVSAQPRLMMSDQGEIERTGRALDIAIEGDGFIEVMGPRGQVLLWRGGSLAIGADGLLSTSDGMALRAAITIPADAEDLVIASDGVVSARLAGADDVIELGALSLVAVDAPEALERLDGGLYRITDEAIVRDLSPGEDGAGAFVQGGVERSNVEITEEMIRLMLVQRAYGANAQVVQAADQLMAIANNLRK